jgi:hypothetical protein
MVSTPIILKAIEPTTNTAREVRVKANKSIAEDPSKSNYSLNSRDRPADSSMKKLRLTLGLTTYL